MRRRSKKVKNFILKALTYLAMIMFVFSALMIGTGSTTYKITLVISMAWLALFALANGWLELDSEGWNI